MTEPWNLDLIDDAWLHIDSAMNCMRRAGLLGQTLERELKTMMAALELIRVDAEWANQMGA